MSTVKTTLAAVQRRPLCSCVGIYLPWNKDLDNRELPFAVGTLGEVSLLQLQTKRSIFDSTGFHLSFPD